MRGENNKDFISLEGLYSKDELTQTQREALAARRPDPGEVSIILLTGGTTGLPKAVPRTHNDFIAALEYHSRAWEITSEDVLLTVAPVSHAQAMHNAVGSAFLHFAKYVITDSTDAEDICRIIEREKVTAFPTVPALVQRMLSLENLNSFNLNSLKEDLFGRRAEQPRTREERIRETEL